MGEGRKGGGVRESTKDGRGEEERKREGKIK